MQRRLLIWDRAAFRSHFDRLSVHDRRLRFHGMVGDAFLDRHCERVASPTTIILGAFENNVLRGVAEVSLVGGRSPTLAELALSVDTDCQNRGVGAALTEGALRLARARQIDEMRCVCTRENPTVCRICRKLGAELTTSEDKIIGAFVLGAETGGVRRVAPARRSRPATAPYPAA